MKIRVKGYSIVTFFHASISVCELLEKQKLVLPVEKQHHRLIQDVSTRWNYTLDMLIRLNEQQPALNIVASDVM